MKFLGLVLSTPGALPPLIWGDPGIGKSARMQQLAEALGLPLEVVIAAIRMPEDFGGLPVPENGSVKRIPDAWFYRLKEAGRGIVFFDEISCSSPATQAALLRVILEGEVGDESLPGAVKIVAAANPPDTAAGGWELAVPLANRFWHTEWAEDSEAFIAWLGGARVKANVVPTIDRDAWNREYAISRSILAAFIRVQPASLLEDVRKIEGRFPMAYATPRTWECTARLHATARVIGEPELLLPLATGAVGEPQALVYASYVREMDLPDPEALLADPQSWTPDASRLDRVFATLLAVAHVAVARSNGKPVAKKRWQAAWQVIDRALDLGTDIVAVPVMTLANRNNRPAGALTSTPEVKRVAHAIRDVVAVAGLME